MRKLSLLPLALLFLSVFTANAQEESAPTEETEGGPGSELTISGSIDTYFRTNLNADREIAPATSFADKPGFAIGMANLVLAKEGAKAGFVADLVFGPRGESAVFNSVGSPAIVNQLYAYWKATDNFKLTLGNFNTFLGYEVISPVANFNYSTSYMFSYGPFSHTGLRADIGLGDKFGLMLAVMNPTDFTDFNPVNTYTFGAQLGYSGDKGVAYLNFIYGDQDGSIDTDDLDAATLFASGESVVSTKPLFQIDLTTGWNLTDAFYIGLNTSYNAISGAKMYAASDSTTIVETESNTSFGYFGVALYPQYSFSDRFALGLRGEYFSEMEGGYGILPQNAQGDGNVLALTLSANIKFGNLTIIPEVRMDSYSEENVIPNGSDASNALISALVAAVYSF